VGGSRLYGCGSYAARVALNRIIRPEVSEELLCDELGSRITIDKEKLRLTIINKIRVHEKQMVGRCIESKEEVGGWKGEGRRTACL
jgi:hypothetical protein